MHVTRLEVRGLRRFTEAQLAPAPGINVITGANGAGKTSLLEALHLMAYGRSFRGRVRDGLVRSDRAALEVFVEWEEPAGPAAAGGGNRRRRRAGLRHNGHAWSGRLDGEPVNHLAELCAALAVVTFEPGSHDLITGAADHRRRYLDWGLFHVEQDFITVSRRYARALKQRNALLKVRAGDAQLDAWDRELAEAGEPLDRGRQRYVEALQPRLTTLGAELVPALGSISLAYRPGWRRDELSLTDALLLARERDLALGYSSIGPHRADWRLDFAGLPGRHALSRGQTKLTALVAVLAQAEHHAAVHGDWPVVALDDLASELDRPHQARVLRRLMKTGAQVFISGTELPIALLELDAPYAQFHVEHGEVARGAGGS